MRRYRSLNDYLKDTFGEKVYKLALDGGMTCPNRDGTKNRRLYILQRGRQRRLRRKIYRQYRDTNYRCYSPYKRQD